MENDKLDEQKIVGNSTQNSEILRKRYIRPRRKHINTDLINSSTEELGQAEGQKTFFKNPFNIFYILILIILMPLGKFIYDLFSTFENPKLILNFYKVFISWPVAILIIIFIVVQKFHPEISSLINRIEFINWKKGQAYFQDSQKAIKFKTSMEDDNKSTTAISSKLSEGVKELIKALNLPDNKLSLLSTTNVFEKEVNELNQKNFKLNQYIFFERIYKALFKSQINLLKQLMASPIQLRWLQIYSFIYPKTLWNYPFDIYMNFLINAGLINLDPPTGTLDPLVKITELGKEFLRYLATYNYTGEEKPNQ